MSEISSLPLELGITLNKLKVKIQNIFQGNVSEMFPNGDKRISVILGLKSC